MSVNVAAADWIRERLSAPTNYVVSSIVPGGFAAYARILHPVQEPRDGSALVRWADVSRWSGVAMRPQIQWCEVALPEATPATEPPWRNQGPREGSLFVPDAEALVDDLLASTPGAESCYFCLWIGYFGGGTPFVRLGDPPVKAPETVQPPRLVELPWREYGLFEGHLDQATSLDVGDARMSQTPNLWWPSDHAWCVASEIDMPWTYVGGSRELIERVLNDERLEAYEVAPDDLSSPTIGGWLADVIEGATDEVIERGTASRTLALGTVEVRWEPSRRRGRGLLTTKSIRVNGEGSSTSPVKSRDSDELRRQIHFRILGAVLALVGR